MISLCELSVFAGIVKRFVKIPNGVSSRKGGSGAAPDVVGGGALKVAGGHYSRCTEEAYLERFKKYCSHAVKWNEGAVFLGYGCVSAQSQDVSNLLLRQNFALTQKSPLRTATAFFKAL